MERGIVQTKNPSEDIFERHSDNLSSDEKYPVCRVHVKKNVFNKSLPDTVLVKKLYNPSIYLDLIGNSSPYIETVYGICETEDGTYAVCEDVRRPAIFDYKVYDAAYNRSKSTSLSLDDLIDEDVFGSLEIQRKDGAHFLSEKTALILVAEMIDGLMSLSDTKRVHGDLSPQNILLADAEKSSEYSLPFRPVIIDFDTSKPVKEAQHQVTTIIGTKAFAAPEIMIYNKPTDRVDIYSIGCLLHFMILGKAPGENKNGLKDSEGLLSKGVYRIIAKCNADYDTRYRSFSELRKAVRQELHLDESMKNRVMSVIPGFRTHTWWKMAIAIPVYIMLIVDAILTLIYGAHRDNLITLAFFVSEIVCVCDVFNLKRFIPKYIYWRERKPVIGHLVRIVIAVVIFIIYSAIL